MQFNGTLHDTALMERPSGLPAVGGPLWFEQAGRPFVLQMAYPLSSEAMVAALYLDGFGVEPEDLATAEDVCGQIAVTLTNVGMLAIEHTMDDIEHGRIDNPDWLEFCRQRVAEVTR